MADRSRPNQRNSRSTELYLKLKSQLQGYLSASSLERLNRFLLDPEKLQAVTLWSAAIAVGFAAVAYAKLFKYCEEVFRHITSMYPEAPFLVTPVCVLIAWLLVHRFAPFAGGSGIPQIMAANELNENPDEHRQVRRLLSMRTAAIKVASSLICVVGGGAIGREGPTLQISASIFHFFRRQITTIEPRVRAQAFIVAGAAAGLASAFNTPLGGIVYAIEELGSHHFHKVRTALLSAVIVSGLMAQWILGSYLYLGFPVLVPAGIEFVPWSLLVGVLSGAGGALFGMLLFKLSTFRAEFSSFKGKALVTVGAGLLLSTLIYFQPQSAGSGYELMNGYLFHSAPSDFGTFIARNLATALTYVTGSAGGIFAPSLSIGATLGAFVSDLFLIDNRNLVVLLGMIGFLTGVTRTPFTSFILVIEMSDRHSAIMPMMITALIAQAVASRIAPDSFYELVKRGFLKSTEQPMMNR